LNAVEPERSDLRAFIAADDGEPVVMLNLLRFDGAAGRAGYAAYARRVAELLSRVGGRLVYAGDCGPALVAPAEHAWDAVLLVEYPSREAFLAMARDPDYEQISELRRRGLTAAVLQPTARMAYSPE
jgi:uncharacterized protein (DUF1330 family)